MSAGLERFAFNQRTTPAWSLEQAVSAYARAGLGGIGIWREPLAECGIERAARLLRESGLKPVSLCRGTSFAAADAAAWHEALDDNRRAIAEAAAIGAGCLVIVAGGLPTGSRDIEAARERVREGLAVLLPKARAAGVVLGIEPLHPMYAADRCCVNTLEQANDLCDTLGEGTAVVADVYHCWWDPHFRRELERAGAARIATFHYCDWLVPTRDLLLDRGMVGDGVIDHGRVRGWLDAIGYDGPFELEIFSAEDWWRRSPEETLRVGIERCAPLVGPRRRA